MWSNIQKKYDSKKIAKLKKSTFGGKKKTFINKHLSDENADILLIFFSSSG